jgi:2-amino-4-hydroxy-6-hydroxymethyldihydropteridine diphosphokinase
MSRDLIIKRGSHSLEKMEYTAWEPQYERIRREFGFSMDREERSADRLEALLSEEARTNGLVRASSRLRGRDVVVVGLAPRSGPPPIWRLGRVDPPPVVVAADGATSVCLEAGIVPAVVTTDLDGPLPAEVNANRKGSLLVVHAHGDNSPAVEEWVPQFPGELAGSWAGAPRPALLNVGGFTDGDRAVCLAEHARARRILLWGFVFDRVEEPTPSETERKRSKLRWAERIIGELARSSSVPIVTWRRDGTQVPYGGGISDASTR